MSGLRPAPGPQHLGCRPTLPAGGGAVAVFGSGRVLWSKDARFASGSRGTLKVPKTWNRSRVPSGSDGSGRMCADGWIPLVGVNAADGTVRATRSSQEYLWQQRTPSSSWWWISPV